MTLFHLAMGLWLGAGVIAAINAMVVGEHYMRRFDAATGSSLSQRARLVRLFREPLGLIRSTPRDTRAILDAMGFTNPDPELERLRNRASLAVIVMWAVPFAGLPASLLLVGVLARVVRFLNVPDWVYVAPLGLVVIGVIGLIWSGRRARLVLASSTLAIVVAVVLLSVALIDTPR